MPDCGICSELSNDVDEALSSVTTIVKRLQTAMAKRGRGQESLTPLELLLLENAMARKSAAFNVWLDHKKTHGGSQRRTVNRP